MILRSFFTGLHGRSRRPGYARRSCRFVANEDRRGPAEVNALEEWIRLHGGDVDKSAVKVEQSAHGGLAAFAARNLHRGEIIVSVPRNIVLEVPLVKDPNDVPSPADAHAARPLSSAAVASGTTSLDHPSVVKLPHKQQRNSFVSEPQVHRRAWQLTALPYHRPRSSRRRCIRCTPSRGQPGSLIPVLCSDASMRKRNIAMRLV